MSWPWLQWKENCTCGQEQIGIWKPKNSSIHGNIRIVGDIFFVVLVLLIFLFILSCCCNNIIDQVAYKQQKFIPHSSKGWDVLRSKHWQIRWEPALGFIGGCLFTVSSRGERSWLALWGLSYKGTDPNTSAPPSWPKHFQKVIAPNTVTLGIRFQHMNFGVIETFKL